MQKSISSGFKNIDSVTGGLFPGEVTVIGSRPAYGKTSLLLTVINNVCIKEKNSAVFFSLDLSKELVQNRLLSQLSGVASQIIRKGIFSTTQQEKLDTAKKLLNDAPLIIDETSNLKIDDLYSRAKEYAESSSAKIIFIDYIGFISTENENAIFFEQQAEIIKKVRILAKELNIPVVVNCQIARSCDNEIPTLAGLRGSGFIEDVADVIILLHRKSQHDTNALAIIAKNKNGPTGNAELEFNPEYCMFSEKSGNTVMTKTNEKKTEEHKRCLDSDYTFENFYTEEENEFSKKIMESFVDNPEGIMFLYGETGLGKSHLLQALGNALFSDKSIEYVTCEDFVSSFVASISNRTIETEFLKKFIEPDVFLIDDFHYINNKEASQTEFLRILKQRKELHKLTVIASDRGINQLQLLNSTLKDILQSSYCVELNKPGYISRMKIAKSICKFEKDEICHEVLEKFVNAVENPRALIGLVKKTNTYCELIDKPLTLEIAEKMLKEIF